MPPVGLLGALLVRMHHDFDPQRFLAPRPHTEDAYASFLGKQLTDPDIVVLVAEQGGEVIGYTYAGVEGTDYMSLRGPAGVLYDIVVDPAENDPSAARDTVDVTEPDTTEPPPPRTDTIPSKDSLSIYR